jgi:hypothetical protein
MVPVGAEREFDVPVADLLIQVGRAVEVRPPAPPIPTPDLNPFRPFMPTRDEKKAAKKDRRNAKLHR